MPRQRGDAPHAAGQEEDDQQERDAQRHLPGIWRELERVVANKIEQNRANDGCEYASRATKDCYEDELSGLGPESQVGRDMPHGAGQAAGEHVGDIDDAPHRDAQVLDTLLVVPDRTQRVANWRDKEPVGQVDQQRAQDESELVQVR